MVLLCVPLYPVHADMRFTVQRYSAVPTSNDGQVPRSEIAICPPDGGPVNEEEGFSPPSEEIDSVEPTPRDALLRQQSNYSTVGYLFMIHKNYAQQSTVRIQTDRNADVPRVKGVWICSYKPNPDLTMTTNVT